MYRTASLNGRFGCRNLRTYFGWSPYYHATRDRLLALIRQHSLGGSLVEQNSPGCVPGVYLSENLEMALIFLLKRRSRAPTGRSVPSLKSPPGSSSWSMTPASTGPSSDPTPQVDHPEIWLYDGIIDVTNPVVVPIDDLL